MCPAPRLAHQTEAVIIRVAAAFKPRLCQHPLLEHLADELSEWHSARRLRLSGPALGPAAFRVRPRRRLRLADPAPRPIQVSRVEAYRDQRSG